MNVSDEPKSQAARRRCEGCGTELSVEQHRRGRVFCGKRCYRQHATHGFLTYFKQAAHDARRGNRS